MDTTRSKPLGRPFVLKLLVLAPLLMSAAASILLAAVAPFAWGAAQGTAIDAWVPAFSALALALPVLMIAGLGIPRVWRRMSGLFEVDVGWALVAAGAHWTAAVCLVIFAGTMGSEDSYRSLGEDVSTGGFVFLTVLASAIGSMLLGGLTMVYVWSIGPGRKLRLSERHEDEPDFVADWGRRRRR